MPIKSIEAEQAYQALWLDPTTAGAVLFILTIDSYGQEIFDLEPVVIREELESGFRVNNIPQVNIDKLMAIWTSLASDTVHTDVPTFINACNALSGTMIDAANFDPADPYEIAWGIAELTFMDASTPQRLGSDVKRYIGETCKAFGIFRPPYILASVADFGDDNYAANAESHAVTSEDLQGMNSRQDEYKQDIADYVQRQTTKLILDLHKTPLIHRDDKAWGKFVEGFAHKLEQPTASS